MSTRGTERREFLGDIISTAVEGGIGYWSQVSQYQYETPAEIQVCVGQRDGDEACATVHEVNDDETGYKAEGVKVTLDAVAAAIGKIGRGEARVHESYAKRIAEASRENDAGEIDAGDADVIVQVAVLGEVVYG